MLDITMRRHDGSWYADSTNFHTPVGPYLSAETSFMAAFETQSMDSAFLDKYRSVDRNDTWARDYKIGEN